MVFNRHLISLWMSFSEAGGEWLNHICYWGLWENPYGVPQWQSATFPVPSWSTFISPIRPLPYLMHTPGGWGLLFGLSLKQTLFLRKTLTTIHFQMTLLTQLKHRHFNFFLKPFEILLSMRSNISHIFNLI